MHRTARRVDRAGNEPTGAVVQLDVRNNSLNLIRLILAMLVLVAHAYPLSGSGDGSIYRGGSVGGWAVFGFFVISGYLITASRLANSFGRYLALRIARIYPAFLVCLVVTAVVFAPIAYVIEHGSLSDFLTTPTSPFAYVLKQLPLHIVAYDVAGTPSGVPYPEVWNGSLWTLFHEFCCYLLVGLVLCLPFVRRHRWVIAAGFVASVALWAGLGHLPVGHIATLRDFAQLLPAFLGGALLQRYSAHLPLRALPAVGSAVVAVGLIVAIPGWGWQASAPLLAYLLLWISTVLPSPALIKRHDISYGAYIYAFPVQQLLVYTGVTRLGLSAYDAAAVAVTSALATASWLAVERPALRRARRARRPRTEEILVTESRQDEPGTVGPLSPVGTEGGPS
jgi:peptidoglycan/LPS O-acetylase OafA/YrhL